MQGKLHGPDSVRVAVEELKANRIGHGVRSIEDEKLIAKLIQKEIALEVCPISNLQTNALKVKNENEYYKKIKELWKKGVRLTINTDNNTVSNTTINDEYINMVESNEFTIDDLQKMNINAIRAAFTTPQKKAELIAKIKERENEDLQK